MGPLFFDSLSPGLIRICGKIRHVLLMKANYLFILKRQVLSSLSAGACVFTMPRWRRTDTEREL